MTGEGGTPKWALSSSWRPPAPEAAGGCRPLGPGAHTQDTRGSPRRLTLLTLGHTAAGSPAPRIATLRVSEAFCEVSCNLLNCTWWQTDGPHAGGGSQAGHLLLTKCVCGGCNRGADGFESGPLEKPGSPTTRTSVFRTAAAALSELIGSTQESCPT